MCCVPERYRPMIFFLVHNKFALSEYTHVHSVVLKVWFVKYSQITMFTLKISP